MIKNDFFLNFLFLFAKANIVPFEKYEDYSVNNYKAIDTPFFDLDEQIEVRYKYFNMEFSSNMLKLGAKRRFWYVNSLKDAIISDTNSFDQKELIDYLLTLDIKTDDLNYKTNLKFEYLLHENLLLDTDEVDFEKSIKVIRLYYKYLLNVKRDEILNRLNNLIQESNSNSISPVDEYKIKALVPGEEIVVNDESKSEPEKPVNPYQRIFTSYYAFSFFEKLLAEFGIKKNYLSNYSFVYHKMVKDKLIYHDIKQIEYYDFLAIYDIHISRIKGLNDMGNTQLRESIYASVKESHKIVT